MNGNISDLFFGFDNYHTRKALADEANQPEFVAALRKDAEEFLVCAGELADGISADDLVSDFTLRM
tara:strand:+ start:31 stop:228 length:198 start_codon:yes stop_codon:yes gene_type:complete